MSTNNTASTEFSLRRIFATVSSEAPKVPESFEYTETPQLDVQLNIKHQPITSSLGNHMVELSVVVTAKQDKETVFLVEVNQSGLFTAKGFDEETLHKILNIHCPSLLYPYASALISDLVLRAGFMPLHLPAVDFNAMYEQQKQENQTKDA